MLSNNQPAQEQLPELDFDKHKTLSQVLFCFHHIQINLRGNDNNFNKPNFSNKSFFFPYGTALLAAITGYHANKYCWGRRITPPIYNKGSAARMSRLFSRMPKAGLLPTVVAAGATAYGMYKLIDHQFSSPKLN